NDGSWEHRAYWGQNRIQYGTDGTPGRRYMGALPTAGQWVRLEVPASQVGLEGSTISGMAFSLFDGRATWDYAGTSSSGGSGSGNGSGSDGGGSFTNPPPATNSLPQLTTNGIAGINQSDYVTLDLPQVRDNGV